LADLQRRLENIGSGDNHVDLPIGLGLRDDETGSDTLRYTPTSLPLYTGNNISL